jgi:uncharacterized protein
VITYFDPSAFVPLLVAEDSSEFCTRLWDESDSVVTTRLTYVEAAAALAQAVRMKRMIRRRATSARARLDDLWPDFEVIGIDSALAVRAADLAFDHDLRGYDAVHCAAAELFSAENRDLIAAAGDRALLGAWRRLGLSTADVTASAGG